MMDGPSASLPPSPKTEVLIDLWHLGPEASKSRFLLSLLDVAEIVRTKDLSGRGYFMCCRTPDHERKGEEQVEAALKDLGCGEVVGAETFAAALYAVKQKLDENDVEKVIILLSWERKSLVRKYMEQLFTRLYRYELIELPMSVKEQRLKKSWESRSKAGPRGDPEAERIQKEISQFLESLPSLKGDLRILKSSLIPEHIFLHGFTTRTGGISYVPTLSSLNLFSSSKRRDPPAVVKENLRRLSHAAGFNPDMYHSIKVMKRLQEDHQAETSTKEPTIPLHWPTKKGFPGIIGFGSPKGTIWIQRRVLIRSFRGPHLLIREQVNHASDVWVMGQAQPESYDGIVTNQRDVTVTAPGADCIPVLFADPVKKVCGAAHSGWQGTLLGVSMAVVNAMVTAYGSDVKDILVVLGPSVGPCCFTLPKQSAKKFYKIDPTCVRCFESPNPYVDIRRATRVLLEAGGILPINIQDDSVTDPEQNLTLCTSCHPDKFYSHVRDGENFGTQIGFISIKN